MDADLLCSLACKFEKAKGHAVTRCVDHSPASTLGLGRVQLQQLHAPAHGHAAVQAVHQAAWAGLPDIAHCVLLAGAFTPLCLPLRPSPPPAQAAHVGAQQAAAERGGEHGDGPAGRPG